MLFQIFIGISLFLSYAVYAKGFRQLLVACLNIYRRFNLLILRLQGSSPKKEKERLVVSGELWDNYCDGLKAAGAALVTSGSPTDPFNQAEGIRYLTRLVRGSLASFLEGGDVDRPVLTTLANGNDPAPVKLGLDNPDNFYQSCVVSSRKAYLLKVKRNTVHYLGFGTQSGSYGKIGGLSTVDYKESLDFEGGEEFEVFVSPSNIIKHKNFLKMDPEVEDGLLIVRQTFNDIKEETPAKVEIIKTGDFEYLEDARKLGKFVEAKALSFEDKNDGFEEKDKLSCDHVVEALNKSTMLVAGASMMFAKWAKDFQAHKNKLPLFDVEKSNKVGGDPFIRYFHSYWELKDDEALVIQVTPPENVFSWNFQLCNHWLESLDYKNFRIHVNQATAKYRADGSVCIIVTSKNPISQDIECEYNWLTTTGHNQGGMCFRWIKPQNLENFPHPEAEVVKFSELAAYLM